MKSIPRLAEELSMECLNEAEKPHDYSSEDLLNATLIFTHFLMDHIWQSNQDLPQKKREALAFATGEAIRELIKVSTGKDMHLITKIALTPKHEC